MKKNGTIKAGIILVLLQIIAYLGSSINGSLTEMLNFNGQDAIGKLIGLVGYNIPLIVGIIFILVGRKPAKRT